MHLSKRVQPIVTSQIHCLTTLGALYNSQFVTV